MKIPIITDIINFFSKALKVIKSALKNGQEVTNKIKAVADSKVVSAIVAATPNPYDDALLFAIRNGLTIFATAMGWADKLIKDFEGDKDAKTVVYTALAAKAAVIEAEYKGEQLTIQQALAATPVVYNPDIVKV